jgi:uncharacterized protein (TIGR04255 family)
MTSPYKRPPITEAIIEVRIVTALDMATLDKMQKRYLEDYPAPPQSLMNVDFEVGELTKIKQEFESYRLTAADGAGIVAVGPSRLATSRLPPYEGWDLFAARARKNWEIWKKVAGWREIRRIGVRYLNRIDIPSPPNQPITLDEYLTVSPRLPAIAGFPPMNHFAVNAQAPLGKDGCNLILNVGNVASPLVDTVSFLLDLDLSLDTNLPRNDEALWGFVDRMRQHKNAVFEACITDKTRSLFSS